MRQRARIRRNGQRITKSTTSITIGNNHHEEARAGEAEGTQARAEAEARNEITTNSSRTNSTQGTATEEGESRRRST